MDEFIEKQIEITDRAYTTCKKAYENYVQFQKIHLLNVLGKRAFINEMVRRGFKKQRGTNNKMIFRNVEINPVFKRGS